MQEICLSFESVALSCPGYSCVTVSLLSLHYLYKCAISVINMCEQCTVYLSLNIRICSQKKLLFNGIGLRGILLQLFAH